MHIYQKQFYSIRKAARVQLPKSHHLPNNTTPNFKFEKKEATFTQKRVWKNEVAVHFSFSYYLRAPILQVFPVDVEHIVYQIKAIWFRQLYYIFQYFLKKKWKCVYLKYYLSVTLSVLKFYENSENIISIKYLNCIKYKVIFTDGHFLINVINLS